MFNDDFVHEQFGKFLTMGNWNLYDVKDLDFNTSYKRS
jgi:hypothetical protein